MLAGRAAWRLAGQPAQVVMASAEVPAEAGCPPLEVASGT